MLKASLSIAPAKSEIQYIYIYISPINVRYKTSYQEKPIKIKDNAFCLVSQIWP